MRNEKSSACWNLLLSWFRLTNSFTSEKHDCGQFAAFRFVWAVFLTRRWHSAWRLPLIPVFFFFFPFHKLSLPVFHSHPRKSKGPSPHHSVDFMNIMFKVTVCFAKQTEQKVNSVPGVEQGKHLSAFSTIFWLKSDFRLAKNVQDFQIRFEFPEVAREPVYTISWEHELKFFRGNKPFEIFS